MARNRRAARRVAICARFPSGRPPTVSTATRPVAVLTISGQKGNGPMHSCELDGARGLNANEAMTHHPLTAFETALIEAALALTARLDVRETCRAMLDVAQRMFSAHSSWILLHDSDSNDLV